MRAYSAQSAASTMTMLLIWAMTMSRLMTKMSTKNEEEDDDKIEEVF
jgi:hypothetical protein